MSNFFEVVCLVPLVLIWGSIIIGLIFLFVYFVQILIEICKEVVHWKD